MEKEFTEVYCGGGKGKTTLAIGQCLRASAQGKSVIIIQFLKGRERRELDFLEELDNLDIKIFRFEKHDEGYEELNEQEKAEEKTNILNALNFAAQSDRNAGMRFSAPGWRFLHFRIMGSLLQRQSVIS